MILSTMTSSQFAWGIRKVPRLRNHIFFPTSKHTPEVGVGVSLPTPGKRANAKLLEKLKKTGLRGSGTEMGKASGKLCVRNGRKECSGK